MYDVNRRRERRRDFRYIVFLDYGDDRDAVECRFMDVSRHGARLLCSDTTDVPETVLLKLSETGGSKRLCTVAWSTATEIGLSFIRVKERRYSWP